MQYIVDAGVKCFSGICSEIYKEKCFEIYPECMPKTALVNAKALSDSSLMFEVHPTLSEEIISTNIDELRSVFNNLQIKPGIV